MSVACSSCPEGKHTGDICPVCAHTPQRCERDCYRTKYQVLEEASKRMPRDCCTHQSARFHVCCQPGAAPQGFCSWFCMALYSRHDPVVCQECQICGANIKSLQLLRYVHHPTHANERVFFCTARECECFVVRTLSNCVQTCPNATVKLLLWLCPQAGRNKVCDAMERAEGKVTRALMLLRPQQASTEEAALGMLGAAAAQVYQEAPAPIKEPNQSMHCAHCSQGDLQGGVMCGICDPVQPVHGECFSQHCISKHPVLWSCSQCQVQIRHPGIKPYARCTGCKKDLCGPQCVEARNNVHAACSVDLPCTRCRQPVVRGGVKCNMCPVRHCSAPCIEAHWNDCHNTTRAADTKLASEDSKACGVCMANERNAAIVPCGHKYCLVCVGQLKTCPGCRGKIEFVQRLFD